MQNRHKEFRRITFLLLYPTVYDIAITVDEGDDISAELVRLSHAVAGHAPAHADVFGTWVFE